MRRFLLSLSLPLLLQACTDTSERDFLAFELLYEVCLGAKIQTVQELRQRYPFVDSLELSPKVERQYASGEKFWVGPKYKLYLWQKNEYFRDFLVLSFRDGVKECILNSVPTSVPKMARYLEQRFGVEISGCYARMFGGERYCGFSTDTLDISLGGVGSSFAQIFIDAKGPNSSSPLFEKLEKLIANGNSEPR